MAGGYGNKYLNFDKMDEYVASAKRGQEIAVKLIA
jgi:hypothetical protein